MTTIERYWTLENATRQQLPTQETEGAAWARSGSVKNAAGTPPAACDPDQAQGPRITEAAIIALASGCADLPGPASWRLVTLPGRSGRPAGHLTPRPRPGPGWPAP